MWEKSIDFRVLSIIDPSLTAASSKYIGTSIKHPPRGMVNFGCLKEVSAQQRYSLTGNFETAGGLIHLAHMVDC